LRCCPTTRRIAMDFDHLVECSTAFLCIASAHLMARHLAIIRAKAATSGSQTPSSKPYDC